MGALEIANAKIRESSVQRPAKLDVLVDLEDLRRETDDMLEKCEVTHLSNKLFASPWLINEARQVVDRAERVFCFTNVGWTGTMFVRELERPQCRVRTIMRHIFELQRAIMGRINALRAIANEER
jgi:hypothetical protein